MSAHHRGRGLEHFPGLWAYEQGARPFSHALLPPPPCPLQPCLQAPVAALPVASAPQGRLNLPRLLLAMARPRLSSGCPGSRNPPNGSIQRSATGRTVAAAACLADRVIYVIADYVIFRCQTIKISLSLFLLLINLLTTFDEMEVFYVTKPKYSYLLMW